MFQSCLSVKKKSQRNQLGSAAMFLAAVSFAAAGVMSSAAYASGISLLPHRAIYDLQLMEASDRSGIQSIEGRAAFDITGSRCDGYVLNTRLVFRTKLRTGRTVVADSRVSTFETGDGSQLDFTTTDFLNGQETESTRGTAVREDDVLRIELAEPEKEPFNLDDRGVVFPALQMKKIIEAAQDGQTIITMPLFDGTQSGDSLYETTTIITPITLDRTGDTLLTSEDSIDTSEIWRITISYFEDDGTASSAETPISEISFDLYNNGVTDNLVLDYGDYRIAGVLSEYAPGDEVTCE